MNRKKKSAKKSTVVFTLGLLAFNSTKKEKCLEQIRRLRNATYAKTYRTFRTQDFLGLSLTINFS